MARKALGPLNTQAELRPAASPVDTYFGIPGVSEPTLRTIEDLSPLSNALDNFIRSMAPGFREDAQRKAAAFYAENKEEIHKAGSTGDVEALVSKTLKGTQSPLFYKSLYSQAGQSLAALYQGNLNSALEGYTRVSDENGLLVEPQESVDQIQARATQEILKHPLMRDFYARSSFADAKQQVDERFTVTAVTARGNALKEYQKQQAKNGISLDLEGMLLSTSAKESKAHFDSLDMRIQELYSIFGADARAMFWEAGQTSVREVATNDPQKALEMIELVAGTKVGGALLGEDTRYQAQLAELRKNVIDRRDAEDADVPRKLSQKRAEADLTLERDFYPALDAAWESGENLVSVQQNMAVDLPAKFGEWADYANQKIRGRARALRSTSPSIPTSVQTIEETARIDPEAAQILLDTSMELGDVVGPDVLKLQRAIAAGKDTEPFLRDANYQAALRSLDVFKPAGGMSPEYSIEAQGVYEGRVQAFQRAYLEVASANRQDPGKVQAWLVTQQDALQKELQATRLDNAKNRQAALDAINRGQAKGLSMSAEIDTAAKAGLLTQDEQRAYRKQGLDAATLESYLNSVEVRYIGQRLNTQASILGRETDRLAMVNKVDELMADFRKEGRKKLTALAADETLSPEQMQEAWRLEVEKFDADARKLVKDFAVETQKQQEAEDFLETRRAFGRELDAWTQDLTSISGKFSPPTTWINPDVEASEPSGFLVPGFYNQLGYAVGAVQRRRPDADVIVAKIRSLSGSVLVKLLSNTQLDDTRKADAVSNVIALTGTSPEILADGVIRTGVGPIKLNDDIVNPFTTPLFQSSEALRDFMDTRPDLADKIMRRFGLDPNDEASTYTFIAAQRIALRRLNTDG